MNPEEGDLRPQLLDRFGLAAEIRGDTNPSIRAEIVRRRIAYDADPAAFLAEWTGRERGFADSRSCPGAGVAAVGGR